ncbi:hypothetical protein SteCoe_24583 [Stentor coeruleus]|uniref:Peptidase C1A papain C-terminal domain-containing protein n=1 Tax=Stentor coeruleus TaxID=5963 RepID=A0A1R2BH46_9CILI|nr:hypothetical protein SteCoe_24583 [Stentor coeruleus]
MKILPLALFLCLSCLFFTLYYLQSNTSYFLISKGALNQAEFDSYLISHGKSYTDEEYQKRLKIFSDKIAYIRLFNSQNRAYTLGLNQFSDLDYEEFASQHFSTKTLKPISETLIPKQKLEYPSIVDWRTKNVVTPVQNEGSCACGWAFATAGAIEGFWALVHHQLNPLSSQQLLDCSDYYGNNGCNGGFISSSFNYAILFGLTTAAKYPYTGAPKLCNSGVISPATAQIKSYAYVSQNNPTALLSAVSEEPVAVNVDASSWVNYKSGVIDVPCVSTTYNYWALIVGYNMQNSPPYYIVKTSWGTSFGQAGYVYVQVLSGSGSSCIQGEPLQVTG